MLNFGDYSRLTIDFDLDNICLRVFFNIIRRFCVIFFNKNIIGFDYVTRFMVTLKCKIVFMVIDVGGTFL